MQEITTFVMINTNEASPAFVSPEFTHPGLPGKVCQFIHAMVRYDIAFYAAAMTEGTEIPYNTPNMCSVNKSGVTSLSYQGFELNALGYLGWVLDTQHYVMPAPYTSLVHVGPGWEVSLGLQEGSFDVFPPDGCGGIVSHIGYEFTDLNGDGVGDVPFYEFGVIDQIAYPARYGSAQNPFGDGMIQYNALKLDGSNTFWTDEGVPCVLFYAIRKTQNVKMLSYDKHTPSSFLTELTGLFLLGSLMTGTSGGASKPKH